MVEIVLCESEGEAVSEGWDGFVTTTPSATVSHLYGWRRIISEAYGHSPLYLIARRNGETTGILPLFHIKSRLFGNTLCSMPFQDYGGIVAHDEESARALLDRALQLKDELGAGSLELRHRDLVHVGAGTVRTDKATLILDISSGVESLWKSLSPKVRNQVRKAQKSGLSTRIGGAELLEEFYRPFAVNMRDLGSPVHHRRFFEKLFSVFGDSAGVMLVCEGSKTVGGLIALFLKDTVVVPWASCYRQYFSKCPNNLLYWDAIQNACARSCTMFDFGRSSVGSGTYNFKTQWGAQPIQLNWLILPGTHAPAKTDGAGLQLASSLWKHIPVAWANALGPLVRKHLAN